MERAEISKIELHYIRYLCTPCCARYYYWWRYLMTIVFCLFSIWDHVTGKKVNAKIMLPSRPCAKVQHIRLSGILTLPYAVVSGIHFMREGLRLHDSQQRVPDPQTRHKALYEEREARRYCESTESLRERRYNAWTEKVVRNQRRVRNVTNKIRKCCEIGIIHYQSPHSCFAIHSYWNLVWR